MTLMPTLITSLFLLGFALLNANLQKPYFVPRRASRLFKAELVA
jgi:hypothetical protein